MEIDDFVVGLGYDYDDSGAKSYETSLDSIRTKTLQVGGVVAGAFGAFAAGAFGAGALALNFAQETDAIGKAATDIGVTANQIHALGVALQSSGGHAEDAVSQLREIASIREGFLTGDINKESLPLGFDTSAIFQAKDAFEAYLAIADQFSKIDNVDQRNAIAKTLGLSQSSRLFLNQDPENIRASIEEIQRVRSITDEMTANAAAFNDAVLLLKENVGSVADIIGNDLAKSFTGLAGRVNNFFNENREEIRQGAKDFVDSPARFVLERTPTPIPTGISDDDLFRFFDNIRSVFGDDEARSRLDAFQAKKDADADIEARAFFNSFIPDVSVANVAASLSASRSPSTTNQTVTRVDITDKTPIQVVVKLDGKVLDDHIERRELIKNAQILEAVTTPVDD